MFDIGWGEWVLIFVLVLLFFGPKKLPEVARGVGRTLRHFQDGFKEFKDQVEKENKKDLKNFGETAEKGPDTRQ